MGKRNSHVQEIYSTKEMRWNMEVKCTRRTNAHRFSESYAHRTCSSYASYAQLGAGVLRGRERIVTLI